MKNSTDTNEMHAPVKYLLLIIACFIFSLAGAQNPNAAQIRQQMAAIRQNTDWNNPDEAKKANEKIRELSKQLMMANMPAGQPASQPADEQQKEEAEAGAEYRMKLWEQMWETARAGEDADIDLARPLRSDIKKAYEEDESREIKNPQFFSEMTFLCIDMSSPAAEEVISVMENYKSIRTLVITGGKNKVPADLNRILSKAAGYPLESLYIINFGKSGSEIPESVGAFKSLTYLGLCNNALTRLPGQITQLVHLRKLFVDMNPVVTLLPVIGTLTSLDTLGVVQTPVTAEELNRIAQQLPNCKILTQ